MPDLMLLKLLLMRSGNLFEFMIDKFITASISALLMISVFYTVYDYWK